MVKSVKKIKNPYFVEIGRKGGLKVLKLYGPGHFSMLAKWGAEKRKRKSKETESTLL